MLKFFVPIFILFHLSTAKTITLSPDVEKKLNIKTIKAQVKTFKDVKVYPGTVLDNPILSFDVSSPVEGIVENVYVKQGDGVKNGYILIRVYSPQIASLKSNIEIAKVRLKTALDTLEREQMLYREEVIPYSRFYSAKIDYEKAKGELEALQKALRSYGEVEGNSLILRSKVDGFIAESKVIRGMPVNTGDSLMKVHSHRILWVEVMVPFEDVKKVKVGSKVYVVNPEGRRIEGTITLINHEIDPKTSRNMVRVEVKNPGNVIKPNMFINVEIPVLIREGIVLPRQSILSVNGKSYIFLKERNSITLRQVSVSQFGDSVEVKSGINEGEEVVTEGVIFLKAQFFGSGE
ncbi:MAG: efflux RND transporter periplasmic adaptor subunit [Hydrogenothermaceae bacterium]|nr:efflux RND transporter periplasmic adaptor subunit [Hydrogenothermaceae bacterium]